MSAIRKLGTCALVVLVVGVFAGPAQAQVVFNEIFANPTQVPDSDGEWFEVYNAGDADVDMDGWTLMDQYREHVIDAGGALIIPAHGFLVFGRSADQAVNGGIPVDYAYGEDLMLSNMGYTMGLYDADGLLVNEALYFRARRSVSWEKTHPLKDTAWGLSVHLYAEYAYGMDVYCTPGFANSILEPVEDVADEVDESVEELVDELVDEGIISDGQGNALMSKLDAILKQIDKGNLTAAANQLGAFVNQVDALLDSGQLTQDEADELLYQASLIEALL